jgi:hypothetical protein
MRRYTRLLGLFILIQACVFAALYVASKPSENYTAETSTKSRLLATMPSPRIVLVGGSNLAFGIDSPLLQKELGGSRHVVNMGLSAGLGLPFELNQALAGLRPGDVAVLSLEYESLWSNGAEPSILWSVLLQQPSAWRFVPTDEKVRLFGHVLDEPLLLAHGAASIDYYTLRKSLGRALGHHSQSPGEAAYMSTGYNKYGDQTAAWKVASEYDVRSAPLVVAQYSQKEIARNMAALQAFIVRCRDMRVQIVYSYPPTERTWYQDNARNIQRMSRILESRLPITFLNSAATEERPPQEFFDTRYHLRGVAVQERTRDLANTLRNYLASTVSASR